MSRKAPEQTVSGSLVHMLGTGVLVSGESGTGKSDLALGLIDRGHQLVADDAVRIQRMPHGPLLGSCPEELSGLLEVRGLGIVPVATLCSSRQRTAATEITLVIHLLIPDKSTWVSWPRLHGAWDNMTILGIAVPRLTLPITHGRPLPLLVETAVRCFHATLREAPHA